jgi:glycosyltransferase involved in cell wall biosynthesis
VAPAPRLPAGTQENDRNPLAGPCLCRGLRRMTSQVHGTVNVDSTTDIGAEGPQPISILYVATVSYTISSLLRPYSEHFRSLGWRIDAAANGAAQDDRLDAAFDHAYELPLSRSIMDLSGMVRATRAMTHLLGSEPRPDIVHVHTPIAGFVTRVAARRLPAERRPAIVYTAHGFHFHRSGSRVTNALFLTVERVAGRWTDRLIVINEEDAESARRHRIVPSADLVQMPGIGLDCGWYSRSQLAPGAIAAARAEMGVGLHTPVFVSVGELNRNKRPGDLIAALRLMRHRDACLVLLGDGRERARLEALARELDLDARVRFLGSVADVRPFVAAATALILASGREGLNRSIMEAMALEVPVVASSARGNRELVGSDAGIVVPIGDVPAFAAAVDWLLDHPAEAHQMGQRGRARAVEKHDLAILIPMHEKLYRAIVNEASGRRQ